MIQHCISIFFMRQGSLMCRIALFKHRLDELLNILSIERFLFAKMADRIVHRVQDEFHLLRFDFSRFINVIQFERN